MKILHVHMAMAGGGIEAMIAGLANEMINENDVEILTIFEPCETDVFLKKLDPKIKVSSLGKKKPGISIKYIWKLAYYVRRHDYDVVHIHAFFHYHFLSVLFNHKKTKYFYTVHSDAVMENTNWDRKLFWLKKFCFRHNWMRPITISQASQDSFKKLYGCDSKLIPNGVKRPMIDSKQAETFISHYKVTNNTKVFFHAGRISKAKNQIALCEAFSQLIKNGYDISLLIAGGNQDTDIYKALTPYFENPRINYLGERNDIPLLFACSDAMVLPSIWEGLPIVLLESLSVGCIPICSPVGGIVNVVTEGYNGILTSGISPNDIYNTICRYLSMSKSEIDIIRKNCIDSFENYDIKNTANKYFEFYQS